MSNHSRQSTRGESYSSGRLNQGQREDCIQQAFTARTYLLRLYHLRLYSRTYCCTYLRCCVGWAWRSHAAAGGQVALGRAGIQRGILNLNPFLKALLSGQKLTPEIRGRRDAISTDKNCEFRARVRLPCLVYASPWCVKKHNSSTAPQGLPSNQIYFEARKISWHVYGRREVAPRST